MTVQSRKSRRPYDVILPRPSAVGAVAVVVTLGLALASEVRASSVKTEALLYRDLLNPPLPQLAAEYAATDYDTGLILDWIQRYTEALLSLLEPLGFRLDQDPARFSNTVNSLGERFPDAKQAVISSVSEYVSGLERAGVASTWAWSQGQLVPEDTQVGDVGYWQVLLESRPEVVEAWPNLISIAEALQETVVQRELWNARVSWWRTGEVDLGQVPNGLHESEQSGIGEPCATRVSTGPLCGGGAPAPVFGG